MCLFRKATSHIAGIVVIIGGDNCGINIDSAGGGWGFAKVQGLKHSSAVMVDLVLAIDLFWSFGKPPKLA